MHSLWNSVIKLNKRNRILLTTTLLIGILAFLIQIYATINRFNISIIIPILGVFCTLIHFSFSGYYFVKEIKLEGISQKLEEEKLVNKSLTIMHDNVRAFKHDFNNIIQSIGGYISTNDMNGLSCYYSQLLDDCQKVNRVSALNPNVINNPAIYSLIASKYYKADNLGIKINLEIYMDLNVLNIKIYELTRILGILLDNAIEATQEERDNEKIINVKMKKDNKQNRQLIIIENTYLDKNINIDRIFEKSFSTKPNNTGLGLWEVRQILKRNNNLNLFTSKDDYLFKQQLEIYA